MDQNSGSTAATNMQFLQSATHMVHYVHAKFGSSGLPMRHALEQPISRLLVDKTLRQSYLYS